MTTSVKTFRARSMPEALALVKRELGPDAVILNTRHLGGGFTALVRGARVEITARGEPPRSTPTRPDPPARLVVGEPRQHPAGQPAVDRPDAPPPSAYERDLPAELIPAYRELVAGEVASELAAQLVREARLSVAPAATAEAPHSTPALRQALRASVARRIPATRGITLTPGATRRVALIGPPGAGKTTTLAKLAAHFALRRKKSVAILSLDAHRLGAHDQLRRFAELIGVTLFTAERVADIRDLMKGLPLLDLLLIDTLGVGPRDGGRFARLAAMLRAVRADEVHLVLPASLADRPRRAITTLFEPLGVTQVVLTKLDEAVGFGVVLQALESLNWGLSYLADGQRIPSDLHEARAEQIAQALVPA